MSGLNEIVSVINIFSEPQPNGTNFDTLLIIGESKKVNRVKSYSNLTEVMADYETTHPEYLQAKIAFSQAVKPSKVMIGQRLVQDEALETYVNAYKAIQAQSDDFYGVTIASRDAAEQLEFIDFMETQVKLSGYSAADPNTLLANNTTNLAYKMFDKKYNRGFCIFSPKADTEYPEAAILGQMLSFKAGSANWCNRTFTGVTPLRDTPTDTNALNKINCNRISAIGGKAILRNGMAASGRFLDVTHGADWLNSEIQYALFNLLTTNSKVNFSNAGGLNMIRNVLNGVLGAAVEREFIQNDYGINIPDAKDISTADKAARILKNVSIFAQTVPGINTIQSLEIYFK